MGLVMSRLFVELPDNEKIVSMIVHNNIIVVASNKHVYTLSNDGILEMILFEAPCDD